MTSPEDESVSWRLIGPVSELSKKQCRLIYSSDGRDADVCLFYVSGEFLAMDARCAHSGMTMNYSTFYSLISVLKSLEMDIKLL